MRWILVHEGLNDITATQMLPDPAQHATFDQIEAGLHTLAERAHARGIRIWAGTLTPLAGAKRFHLHPNETGYRVMAQQVDLRLLNR